MKWYHYFLNILAAQAGILGISQSKPLSNSVVTAKHGITTSEHQDTFYTQDTQLPTPTASEKNLSPYETSLLAQLSIDPTEILNYIPPATSEVSQASTTPTPTPESNDISSGMRTRNRKSKTRKTTQNAKSTSQTEKTKRAADNTGYTIYNHDNLTVTITPLKTTKAPIIDYNNDNITDGKLIENHNPINLTTNPAVPFADVEIEHTSWSIVTKIGNVIRELTVTAMNKLYWSTNTKSNNSQQKEIFQPTNELNAELPDYQNVTGRAGAKFMLIPIARYNYTLDKATKLPCKEGDASCDISDSVKYDVISIDLSNGQICNITDSNNDLPLAIHSTKVGMTTLNYCKQNSESCHYETRIGTAKSSQAHPSFKHNCCRGKRHDATPTKILLGIPQNATFIQAENNNDNYYTFTPDSCKIYNNGNGNSYAYFNFTVTPNNTCNTANDGFDLSVNRKCVSPTTINSASSSTSSTTTTSTNIPSPHTSSIASSSTTHAPTSSSTSSSIALPSTTHAPTSSSTSSSIALPSTTHAPTSSSTSSSIQPSSTHSLSSTVKRTTTIQSITASSTSNLLDSSPLQTPSTQNNSQHNKPQHIVSYVISSIASFIFALISITCIICCRKRAIRLAVKRLLRVTLCCPQQQHSSTNNIFSEKHSENEIDIYYASNDEDETSRSSLVIKKSDNHAISNAPYHEMSLKSSKKKEKISDSEGEEEITIFNNAINHSSAITTSQSRRNTIHNQSAAHYTPIISHNAHNDEHDDILIFKNALVMHTSQSTELPISEKPSSNFSFITNNSPESSAIMQHEISYDS